MTGLLRFAIYNLAASLAAGLLAWGVVMLVLRLLRARSAFLYSSFLALPLVKSILVLLGVGLIFPWARFVDLSRQALPTLVILPYLAAWFAGAWLVYRLLAWRARADLLRGVLAQVTPESRRLQDALSRVAQAYQQSPCCEAGETLCCLSDQIPTHPRLLISDRLRSPVALVSGGQPVVIFPTLLVNLLDEQELDLALAHELNHFALRRPGGWSAGSLRVLALVSPIAILLASALYREEEKACDDLAVRVLGTPEIYAGMLMKSYQFARRGRQASRQNALTPGLLGAKPFLSERIERLLRPAPPGQGWLNAPGTRSAFTWAIWVLLLYLLFFARFGA